MNFFRGLFCEHEWEYVKRIWVGDFFGGICGEIEIYKCPKCLKVKRVKLW